MRMTWKRRKHFAFLTSTLLVLSVLFLTAWPILAEETQPRAEVSAQPAAASVSAGLLHSAMINYDGQVFMWGDNTYGQLGVSGDDYYDSPQWLDLPDQAVAVSLGAYHTLVLLADGTVWAFGRNAFGQLGTGDTENQSLPIRVEGLPKITAISAGSWHSLALGDDGSIWAWGNNTNFQIGDVESEIIKGTGGQVLGSRCTKPVQILTGGAAAIAAGGLHSMYLDAGGQVFAWGDNSKGQLGDGTTQSHAIPAIVPGLQDVNAIAAGYQHSIALIKGETGDQLLAWGDDSLGQLGLGAGLTSDSFRAVPVRVDTTDDIISGNDRILTITAAYAQTAVTVPGRDTAGNILPGRQRLLVWGSNSNGQLALGKASSQNKPQIVGGTFNGWTGYDFLPFDSIALGGSHMLVLSSKGLLAAAGRGDRGQLGNVSVLDRSQLVPVDIADVIRPVWVGDCSLSAVWNEDDELVVRWPAAQDNRTVVNYRVTLTSPLGKVKTIDAGNQLVWTFSDAAPEVAYIITVMACDTGSVEAGDETLSHLTGWIMPASATLDATISDYFGEEIIESNPRFSFVRSNWHPDPENQVRPLEVPWDVSTIYGSSAIELPAVWLGYRIALAAAFILLIVMMIDILRRWLHDKKLHEPHVRSATISQ